LETLALPLVDFALSVARTFQPVGDVLDGINAQAQLLGKVINSIATGKFDQLGGLFEQRAVNADFLRTSLASLTDVFSTEMTNSVQAGFTSGIGGVDRNKVKQEIIDFFEDVGVGVDSPTSRTRVAGETDGESYVDGFGSGIKDNTDELSKDVQQLIKDSQSAAKKYLLESIKEQEQILEQSAKAAKNVS
jgi:hypothetical protein